MGATGITEYAVHAEGLTKRYGKHTVVDELDLAVRPGEFFGFLGPNGAGKSTTIRMLCGLVVPTEGQVTVAGVDVASDPQSIKGRIGLLSEDTALYERLSAAEYLVFAGEMHGLSHKEARRRTQDLLALMELTDAADRPIADYSTGMRKKTGFAAALIHGPQVLFLDEPFNGVDPISVRTLCHALEHLARERGVTVFFTSHVLEVVERLCNRVAVLKDGRIAGCGTVAELKAQASSGANDTLEDAFLTLIGATPDAANLDWF
jgi:ABC-2 type transport system ATP-binding protein